MRRASVQKKLIAKTTQMSAIAMSIGHSSSAYSFEVVIPSGRVIAAATMISCQPQKWIARQEVGRHARLQQPLGRVVDAREHHVADEGEDDGVGVQRADAREGQVLHAQVGLPEGQLAGGQEADQHPDDAEQDRCEDEPPDDGVVVFDAQGLCAHLVSLLAFGCFLVVVFERSEREAIGVVEVALADAVQRREPASRRRAGG